MSFCLLLGLIGTHAAEAVGPAEWLAPLGLDEMLLGSYMQPDAGRTFASRASPQSHQPWTQRLTRMNPENTATSPHAAFQIDRLMSPGSISEGVEALQSLSQPLEAKGMRRCGGGARSRGCGLRRGVSHACDASLSKLHVSQGL